MDATCWIDNVPAYWLVLYCWACTLAYMYIILRWMYPSVHWFMLYQGGCTSVSIGLMWLYLGSKVWGKVPRFLLVLCGCTLVSIDLTWLYNWFILYRYGSTFVYTVSLWLYLGIYCIAVVVPCFILYRCGCTLVYTVGLYRCVCTLFYFVSLWLYLVSFCIAAVVPRFVLFCCACTSVCIVLLWLYLGLYCIAVVVPCFILYCCCYTLVCIVSFLWLYKCGLPKFLLFFCGCTLVYGMFN